MNPVGVHQLEDVQIGGASEVEVLKVDLIVFELVQAVPRELVVDIAPAVKGVSPVSFETQYREVVAAEPRVKARQIKVEITFGVLSFWAIPSPKTASEHNVCENNKLHVEHLCHNIKPLRLERCARPHEFLEVLEVQDAGVSLE